MSGIDHSGAKSVTPGGSVAGGHTKGPWRAKSGSTPYPECDDADSWIAVVSPAGREVITLYERYSLAPDDRGCWEADARLIAAAPELLDALKDLLGVIDAAGLINLSNGVQLGQTVWFVKASDAVNYATAAIAKATAGETRNAEGAL
jgi:hypothetical protein